MDAGDREAATEAYKKAEEKTAGSGPKMDLVFSTLKYVKPAAYGTMSMDSK